MTTSIEEARASLVRFIKEHSRYPTKKDCREFEWLYSQQTYRRLLGPRNKLTLLEEYGPKIEVVERFCQQCTESITHLPKANKFCGHSCAASYNNIRKAPRKLTTKAVKTVTINKDTKLVYKIKDHRECLQCDETLVRRGQSTYCSLQCQADHKFALRLSHWLETGLASGNPQLRKFITHLDGYKCACCGLSEWNNKPITLEVEHIDGNSEDDCRDNVCLICPNCHSQTDTYKGKNRGNGRHSRSQRYREGKSY